MKQKMSPEMLPKLLSYCHAAGINIKDVRVSSNKDDLVRLECQLCNMSFKYHSFAKHTKSAHNMMIKDYEQKYGERLKNVKEIVFHQCVYCEDFMLLDYVAIRNHLKLRNKNHKTPFSEYFAQVLVDTDKESGEKIKTPDGKDLKLENMDRETPGKEVFNCGECDKTFHYKHNLRRHLKRHEEISPVKSPGKDLTVETKKAASPSGSKRVFCSGCDKDFQSRSGVNKHFMLRHTPKEKWPFKCPLCQQKFVARCDKKRHLLLPNYASHSEFEIPEENSQEFEELLFSEMKPGCNRAEPKTIDADKISDFPKAEIIEHRNMNVDIKTQLFIDNYKETSNISGILMEKTEDEANMVPQENLTPLEALILRIDNNEKIPTDELISIVQQIVKS